MVKRTFTFAAAVIVCAMSQAALAEAATQAAEPTTRRVSPFVERRGDGMRIGRERLGTYNPNAAGGTLSDQERDEIRQFMMKYSPERMKHLDNVPKQREDAIWSRIATQYQALMRVKEQDPQIYDLRVKRLTIEDEMFSLGWQMKHDDDSTSKATAEELRSKRLREQVRLFVENCLEERRVHAHRQMTRARQDQEKLNEMIANKEKLIEEGVNAIENERPGAWKDSLSPLRKMPKPQSATEPEATPAAQPQ